MNYSKRDGDIFYTNLLNTLILFSKNKEELQKITKPAFDPLYEMRDGLEYSFSLDCFETIFHYQFIEESLRDELVLFFIEANNLSPDHWKWELIETGELWSKVRAKAELLLQKMNIMSRKYIEDYTISFDEDGNLTNKGKKI
ncbi:MAG TPA: hypothetical protein PK006_04580 [Saprospiraceae bacterium]|nr:hypothetical protein [Saprospiraceae bacterium]